MDVEWPYPKRKGGAGWFSIPPSFPSRGVGHSLYRYSQSSLSYLRQAVKARIPLRKCVTHSRCSSSSGLASKACTRSRRRPLPFDIALLRHGFLEWLRPVSRPPHVCSLTTQWPPHLWQHLPLLPPSASSEPALNIV